MSTENSLESSKPPQAPPTQSTEGETTVIVRGETVSPQRSASAPKSPERPAAVSDEKLRLREQLPALDDDGDVGISKEQLVTRDGKADLEFTGTLLASAADGPTTADTWEEYRIYSTSGGKHVFSKIVRTVRANESDSSEAEVFDPSPSSVPSQLLRGARELTRSRPLEWTDAATSFFGYNPLAKALYRKIGSQFNEHIN